MGTENIKTEQILDYYLFQKEIKKLLSGNYIKENSQYQKGYVVSSYFINDWKKNMNYNLLCQYLDKNNIESIKKDNKNSLIKNKSLYVN